MLVVSVVQTVSIPHYRPVVSMVQTETDYILCSVQTVVDCVSILHYRPAVSVVQTVVDCVLYLTRGLLYPWFRLFLYLTIGLLYPWFRLRQTIYYVSILHYRSVVSVVQTVVDCVSRLH